MYGRTPGIPYCRELLCADRCSVVLRTPYESRRFRQQNPTPVRVGFSIASTARFATLCRDAVCAEDDGIPARRALRYGRTTRMPHREGCSAQSRCSVVLRTPYESRAECDIGFILYCIAQSSAASPPSLMAVCDNDGVFTNGTQYEDTTLCEHLAARLHEKRDSALCAVTRSARRRREVPDIGRRCTDGREDRREINRG